MDELFTFQASGIKVNYSRDAAPDPAQFTMHTHEWCEFYHIIEGTGNFKIEGSSYALQTDDVLIMRPAEAHYIDIDPFRPYTRLAVHFDPALLQQIDPNGILLRPFFDRPAGKRNLYRALPPPFNTLLQCLTAPGADRRVQILTHLLPLLCEIAQSHGADDGEYERETVDYKIIRYINEHLFDPLCPDDICRRFFISKAQLYRLFKNAVGTTVWDYITVKRLVAARRLIRAGSTAAEAAARCGFNDYSAFYRAYKKKYAHAPSLREK